MALLANAQEGSGTAEGIYLESEKDSATVRTWQAKLRGSTNKFVGYVGSVEEAVTVIRQYELETTTKFSCFKWDKMFGAGGKIIMQQQNNYALINWKPTPPSPGQGGGTKGVW